MYTNVGYLTDKKIASGRTRPYTFSSVFLDWAARLWFLVAIAGQWMFVYYIILAYGGALLRGDLSKWNKLLDKGHIPGDLLGNLVVTAHILLAVVVIVGGPLQLVPQVRKYLPKFHRWNGRTYIGSVLLTSIAGLYIVWVRGTNDNLAQLIGLSLDALLIIIFAGLTGRYAILRKFKLHRQWALRLFMAVSAVWFSRIGFMFWMLLHDSPVGFDPATGQGPLIDFLAFAQYIVPLLVLEIYFIVQEKSGSIGQIGMGVTLVLLTLAMGVGIFAATMGMWLPNL